MNASRISCALLALTALLCLVCCSCSRSAADVQSASPADPSVQTEAEPSAQAMNEPSVPEFTLSHGSNESESVYTQAPDIEPVYQSDPDTENEVLFEIPSVPAIQYPNPLTGLEMQDETMPQARPVAVMLNDIKAALPQYGNSQADMIFELVAEGGITRMLALYQDVRAVSQIGSIRSTRPYYIDIAQGYDAILIHCGGSSEAYSQMSARKTAHIDGIYTSAIFWRDQQRAKTVGSEHSMFTSGALICDYLPQTGLRLTHADGYVLNQEFSDEPSLRIWSPVQHLTVPMSGYKSTTFDYDAAEGAYLVGQFETPYVDGQDGSQVAVQNVLVLYTSVYTTSDSYGHMQVATTGTGTGLYCCGGVSAPINWFRPTVDDPFSYTLEDGSALVLQRGTTYVCVVSNSCEIAIS